MEADACIFTRDQLKPRERNVLAFDGSKSVGLPSSIELDFLRGPEGFDRIDCDA